MASDVVIVVHFNFPNNYMSRDMWRTKFHSVKWGKRAVSYPSGEIWFKNNFRQGTDNNRALSMCHEMMHYLLQGTEGGRPRDVFNPACSFENTKCYGDSDAVKLAATGDWEAVKNVDNYRGWLYRRYLRWCGDWPPAADTHPGDVYHEDPISDIDWEMEGYDEPSKVSWTPLLEIRNQMLGSDWKPFK